MLNCINNSNILRASLELVPIEDYAIIIKNEFENMCTKFGLNGTQMISLVTTLDISLLINHYDTIWDGLNYYSMTCMEKYKNAYIETLLITNLTDNRIELLCDDLQEFIKCNSCINVKNNKCSTFKGACENEHDICVKYLLNNPQKHDSKNDVYGCWIDHRNTNIIDYICTCNGSLDVVKYLFEIQKKDCTIWAIDWACRHGNLDIVKYLFEIQCKNSSTYAIDCASENGHLDVIKYLFEVQKKNCTNYAIDLASQYGHLDVVKYLFEIQKKNCTANAINWASKNGHLDVIIYLFEIQKKNCTTNAIDWASENGHLDVVKYLFEIQNKDCTINAIDWASKNGHLDVIVYLFEIQNKDCTPVAIDRACGNGHLSVVKYLLEIQKKDCTQKSIYYADLNGVVVQYLEMRKKN